MGKLEEQLKANEEAAKAAAESKGKTEEELKAQEEEAKAEAEKVKAEKDKSTETELNISDISEEKLFGYLTEKVGREIKSFEDLSRIEQKEVEKEVRKYDSPESEAYDKFFSETGRSINDFANLKRDWTKESDDTSVMDYLKQDNPYLSNEDIKFKLEQVYKSPKELDPDEHSAEEIANRKNEIRMREIEWKELIAKSRKFHDENKQKYLTPLEAKMQDIQARAEEGKKFWEQGISDAIPEKLEFGDFNYSVKDVDGYKKSLNSIENFFNRYKDENGVLDQKRLAKTIIAGEQVLNNDLLAAHGKHVQAAIIEEQMRNKSNTHNQEINKDIDPDKVQTARQNFINSIKKGSSSLGVKNV